MICLKAGLELRIVGGLYVCCLQCVFFFGDDHTRKGAGE